MHARRKLNRIVALLLSMLMVIPCIPMSALAEETAMTDEGVTVEVIPDAGLTEAPAPEITEDEPDAAEEVIEQDTEAVVPDEEPAATEPSEQDIVEETMAEVPMVDDASPEAEEPADDRHPLLVALDAFGHVYAITVRKTSVYSSPVLKADTLVYTTSKDVFLMLATGYTEHDTVVVWFLDEAGNVVKGFVSLHDLDEHFVMDDGIEDINFLPMGEGMTSIGMMGLFMVNGSYPETDAEPVTEAETEQKNIPVFPDKIEDTTDPVLPDESDNTEPETDPVPDVLFVEPDDEQDEETETLQEKSPVEQDEIPEGLPSITEDEQASETNPEEEPEPEEPVHAAEGEYIGATTKTRVFAEVDDQTDETYYSGEYLGNFVKDATVQVLTVSYDSNDGVWYQVRFLYGDDFSDGKMKWTDYSTAWIKASETEDSDADSCTVTDFAYTLEYLKMTKSSGGRRKLAATPMNGFTLKNINAAVGGFYAWQANLFGSSGHDSDYPQVAKSAAHGLIYATPHYLEGFTVFCLEHNLSGPGEGSGSNQKPKGPYVLVDMDTFVNNSAYGGTTGVRYKASTMHALGWVLRHTYPFMALNRSDSNNEVWSRVAGQFAMREVIKQLEGAQYVRSYWDMDNFYSFSGGAPAVYLTYARWLAENGIAHAYITGNITASNQSLSVSGSNYVGTVTLTTDADLIRIPKSVGSLTGNSGGSDSSYYYVKSGDTIRITSTSSKFTVSMESLSSPDEEANFLVGVPSVSIQKTLVPVYGAPNILKSGSLSFELSLGAVQVTKNASDGTLLKGAVFELLNSAGTVVATATTNAKGIAAFANIQPGSYTVREKTPPQGFKLSATTSKKVTVTAGKTATAAFANPPIQGRIRIVKTDSVTGKPLAGAVFTVTRLSGPDSYTAANIGKVVATLTTNAQGVAETGPLPWGEYEIKEISVPDGYVDSGYKTTVKIN